MMTSSEKISTSLTLHQLELDIHLGWLEAEQTEKQRISIDIEFRFPTPPLACNTDELADTYCYDTLIKNIKTYLDGKKFRLVEHLAYELYRYIKPQFLPETSITIRIAKMPLIPNLTGGVSFCYGDAL